MTEFPIQPGCSTVSHSKYGACFMCCSLCDADLHKCPYCGDQVTHNGLDLDTKGRHPCFGMMPNDSSN